MTKEGTEKQKDGARGDRAENISQTGTSNGPMDQPPETTDQIRN